MNQHMPMRGHLARHVLERLLAADPAAPVNPTARVHLADCDRCGVRKRAHEVALARYLAEHPPQAFARSVLARASEPPPAPKRWAFLRSLFTRS